MARLVPDVTRLDARGGESGDGLEVEDVGMDGVGGDCEGQ